MSGSKCIWRAGYWSRIATAICVVSIPPLTACSDGGDTIIIQAPASAGAGGTSGPVGGSGGNVAAGGSGSGQGGSSGSGPAGGAPGAGAGGTGAGQGGSSGGGAGGSTGGTAGLGGGGSGSGGFPGGECNAVADGPVVAEELGLGEPPIAFGGNVSDGTYHLTRSIDYTNPCDCTHSITLIISGGGTHYEANFDGQRSSGDLSVFDNWLGFTPTCPLGAISYTRDFIGYVSGLEFIDHEDDQVDELTLD